MKPRLLNILAFLFATLQTFAQTYTYDSNYRLTKVVYGNGVTVNYSYDALGNRLTKKVTGATAQTYTITTAVTPVGSGTVTGGGTYNNGTTVELNAIPNAGYEFLKWTDGETANPRTITVTMNQAFTAQFKESTTIPDLKGDIVVDGKVDNRDLNALIDAYLSNANATTVTDLDSDSKLSIADITQLVSIINDNSNPVNNNGHQYVDLGLPSGTLWATCNVGASAPEEVGGLFAWGETETKDTYNWESYVWCSGSLCNANNQTLTKYGVVNAYGVIDNKTTLEIDDDAATVLWKGSWRMPTSDEFQELIDNTTHTWTKLNNIKGYLFTGGNGNSIFLPDNDEGQYWTSTLYSAGGHSTNAYVWEYNNTDMNISGGLRYHGLPIRPVVSLDAITK